MNNAIDEAKKKLQALIKQKWETQKRFEEQIKLVQEEYQALVKAILPQPVWRFKTEFSITEKSGWPCSLPEKTEVIHIRRIITNLDEIQSLYTDAGVEVPGKDNHNRGISYYRMNKVLLTAGGGHYVLPSPQIVEDNEWEEMKIGCIPERIQSKKA